MRGRCEGDTRPVPEQPGSWQQPLTPRDGWVDGWIAQPKHASSTRQPTYRHFDLWERLFLFLWRLVQPAIHALRVNDHLDRKRCQSRRVCPKDESHQIHQSAHHALNQQRHIPRRILRREVLMHKKVVHHPGQQVEAETDCACLRHTYQALRHGHISW